MLKAMQTTGDSIKWDCHACLPMDLARLPDFLPQLRRYRASGVDVVFLNAGYGTPELSDILRFIGFVSDWVSQRPTEFGLLTNTQDIDERKKSGILSIAFNVEGAAFAAREPGSLGALRQIGVRWMLLAYNRNNALGGGCLDSDKALTSEGRFVLEEMLRAGIVPCCSHCGERTARDIIEHSGRPVIFSHSNMRALHDHPRNISDRVVRECGARGGIIGINGIGNFLNSRKDTSTDSLVAHVDHAASLVGSEHVGISLDYVFDMEELHAAHRQSRLFVS